MKVSLPPINGHWVDRDDSQMSTIFFFNQQPNKLASNLTQDEKDNAQKKNN